jgi:hypothetical protein
METPEVADVCRGDNDDIPRAGCRQGLAGEDRIGIESVGVDRRQSGVTDVRPEFAPFSGNNVNRPRRASGRRNPTAARMRTCSRRTS